MTVEKAPLVTVIVVNYNAGEYLLQCLRALSVQSFRDFQVVVADNSSEDGSFDTARRAFDSRQPESGPKFLFVQMGENAGFAKSNNLFALQARSQFVALLNPDAIPAVDWLKRLTDSADRYPQFAMFGSTQINFREPSLYDGVGDNYLAFGVPWRGGFGQPIDSCTDSYEVFSPCAAAAMYRTDRFRAAGGFDESYFCYVEDVDLGFRLRLAGHKCLQVAGAIVRHAGGASSPDRRFAIFHGTRNMIWTFVKNMPGPLFYPLLPAHFCLVAILFVRAVFRGDASPTLRGIAAAIRGLPRCWLLRRSIQSGRIAPVRAIARAMCWTPTDYLRRARFSLGRLSPSSH